MVVVTNMTFLKQLILKRCLSSNKTISIVVLIKIALHQHHMVMLTFDLHIKWMTPYTVTCSSKAHCLCGLTINPRLLFVSVVGYIRTVAIFTLNTLTGARERERLLGLTVVLVLVNSKQVTAITSESTLTWFPHIWAKYFKEKHGGHQSKCHPVNI